MILAIVFGILITFWAYLHVLYDMGAGSKARGWIVYMGWETFNRLQTWLVSPRGDGRTGTRCYRQQFPIHDIPDGYEDPISLVAPASGGLCVNQWLWNGKIVVYNLPGLVSEGNRAEDRRCETLPTSSPILFGTHLRGLHAWVCLEPHRTGAGDTDLYCLALRW